MAGSKDIKGAGKSLVDTVLHEDWFGQDLGGDACQDEAKLWGEAMGVDCLREALA